MDTDILEYQLLALFDDFDRSTDHNEIHDLFHKLDELAGSMCFLANRHENLWDD